MKKICILIIPILLIALVSCDGTESGSDKSSNDVSLPNQIEKAAKEYDDNPVDTEPINAPVTVDGENVDGTESTDVGTTDKSPVDVSVSLPDSLSSRADYSGITIQLWHNGITTPVTHDGTQKIVSVSLDLDPGNNIFCFLLTKDGKTYRSALIHIYYLKINTNLIGKWVRTESDFDISNENDGFEINADAKLIDLENQNGQWVQTEVLAEAVVATDGQIISYNSSYPFEDGTPSTYTLSVNDTRIEITDGTEKIYGVKIQ